LGKINKAATLNFNFFEHGSDVIEEESPYISRRRHCYA